MLACHFEDLLGGSHEELGQHVGPLVVNLPVRVLRRLLIDIAQGQYLDRLVAESVCLQIKLKEGGRGRLRLVRACVQIREGAQRLSLTLLDAQLVDAAALP
mmetsp:Transcript_27070/g.36185  ORF Transcript_27070/g.36185 Transcript_27070/m.36185 type:complete len:101 (-) Transcript_27070:271-573(-)